MQLINEQAKVLNELAISKDSKSLEANEASTKENTEPGSAISQALNDTKADSNKSFSFKSNKPIIEQYKQGNKTLQKKFKKFNVLKCSRPHIMRIRKKSQLKQDSHNFLHIPQNDAMNKTGSPLIINPTKKLMLKNINAYEKPRLPPIYPSNCKVLKEKPRKHLTIKTVTNSPIAMTRKLDYSKTTILHHCGM